MIFVGFVYGFIKTSDAKTMDAVNTAVQAAGKTQTGQAAQDMGNKVLDKVKNLNLLGRSPSTGAAGAAGAVAKASGPNLSLQSGNSLRFNAGRFTATATQSGVDTNTELGSGFSMQARRTNGESYAGLSFRKSF